MELADFFEISVDVLLGYEQQSGAVDKRIERMGQCMMETDFEGAVAEAEKNIAKVSESF